MGNAPGCVQRRVLLHGFDRLEARLSRTSVSQRGTASYYRELHLCSRASPIDRLLASLQPLRVLVDNEAQAGSALLFATNAFLVTYVSKRKC